MKIRIQKDQVHLLNEDIINQEVLFYGTDKEGSFITLSEAKAVNSRPTPAPSKKKELKFTPSTVDSVFKKILGDCTGLSIDKFYPDASFVNDLKMDSLDFLDLIMRLEDEFDIEIDETKEGHLGYIRTVGEGVSYICNRILL